MNTVDLNYLRYHMLRGMSFTQKKFLIQRFGGLSQLLMQDDRGLLMYLTSEQIQTLRGRDALERAVNHAVESMQKEGVQMISFESDAYPECLRVLPDPPMVLLAKGQLRCLEKIGLAIVGARCCQIHSRELAYQISHELAQQGVCIVSGMAKGVDGHAHRGALASQQPLPTIAVMGTGFDRLYPREHDALFEEIVQNGVVLTEQVYGSAFHKAHFPMRNRLIAGLSLGVLVVEAKRKSGSLITADYAMNLNREVMAMPGSCFLKAHQGCHDLIKQGATLVDDVEDVLSVMRKSAMFSAFETEKQWATQAPCMEFSKTDMDIQNDLKPLVDVLLTGALDLEALSGRMGRSSDEVYMQLFDLEQRGFVQQDDWGRYIWCPTMIK